MSYQDQIVYVEIYTEKDGLILKKYSPIKDLSVVGVDFCKSLANITQKQVCLCDTESVVFYSDGENKLEGKDLSPILREVILDKKSLMINVKEGGCPLPLTDGFDSLTGQIIIPLLVNTESVGAVVLCSFDKEKILTDEDVKLVKLGAEFLSRSVG